MTRQWHARGQGFKSPQLHQAQRHVHARSERHLPEICQKTPPVTARTLAVLSGHRRGGVPVVGAYGAAPLLASAAGSLVAHHLIDHPGGDAGVSSQVAAWSMGDRAARGR
jgi:hypothetical protein